MKTARPYLKSKQTHLRFLGVTATILATFSIVPSNMLGGLRPQAPSDKQAIAALGKRGMGVNYLEDSKEENIIALCNCDSKYSEADFARFSNAKRYSDYCIMFDKENVNFDALIIGTLNQTHAVLQLEALRPCKHIYGAKPIVFCDLE